VIIWTKVQMIAIPSPMIRMRQDRDLGPGSHCGL